MNLSDTNGLITLLAGLAILVGIFGVVVPVLPGLALCWAGVLLWAIFADGGWAKWLIFGVATAIAVLGTVVKYVWPGRNLKRSGVPNRSLLAGGLLGLVGFFVVPVVGLVLGFVLGVYLAERLRLADSRQAWPSTKHALKAAGLSMLIELAAGFSIGVTWLIGLAVT
ncbi:DUF456 domain-containing protein [Rhizomonospora bruguierae]|uniref:DUF456 domain-containing protein n=1 Tax=Rhizomonospora bruguierae TaxID=1581705 RepID=UPI001BCF384B|nr:DUF456 domain-containing protein [Micromonospora sp. NBRC 107566]